MGPAKIQLFQTHNGPCPYGKSGRWENVAFYSSRVSDEVYASLLNQGFRRSGYSIYHPVCLNCSNCIPLRVDASRFTRSRSQRRTWRKNQDLCIEHHPVSFTEEGFKLYAEYQQQWHRNGSPVTEEEYLDFLIASPVTTEMVHYYLEGKLIGLGWVDRLPELLSSVYFVFKPEQASRRLGVFSLLYEIECCRRLNRPWLYMGYWVQDSPKMEYKGEYHPAEVLVDSEWVPLDNIMLNAKPKMVHG